LASFARLLSAALLFVSLIAYEVAYCDVRTSKANGYTVIGPAPGVMTSKAIGYSVVGPNPGIMTSKAIGYSVVGPNPGIMTSKAIGYSVIAPPGGVMTSKSLAYSTIGPVNGLGLSKVVAYALVRPSSKQPSVYIFTHRILPCSDENLAKFDLSRFVAHQVTQLLEAGDAN
jgi:hypothetical protein